MRLFTAIDLPDDLLLRLERLISALRSEAFIKWSPIDNVHITTKFVGEWPENRLDEVHQALSTMPARLPFEIEVKGFGWFPAQGLPRVLWSGVHSVDLLPALASDTEKALARLGIKPENKPYKPHITLARIQHVVPLSKLRDKLDSMLPAVVGTFEASRFYLYESKPGSNASRYQQLQEYRFERAGAIAGPML